MICLKRREMEEDKWKVSLKKKGKKKEAGMY